MNLAPHLATALSSVRDGLIWLVLAVVMGARTARDLLHGRLGDDLHPTARRDRVRD